MNTEESRPAGNRAAEVDAGQTSKPMLRQPVDGRPDIYDVIATVAALLDFDNFTRRLIQDAFNEATADYWLRRAADFDNVCRHARCRDDCAACQIALACRRHAALLREGFDGPDDELDALLRERFDGPDDELDGVA